MDNHSASTLKELNIGSDFKGSLCLCEAYNNKDTYVKPCWGQIPIHKQTSTFMSAQDQSGILCLGGVGLFPCEPNKEAASLEILLP